MQVWEEPVMPFIARTSLQLRMPMIKCNYTQKLMLLGISKSYNRGDQAEGRHFTWGKLEDWKTSFPTFLNIIENHLQSDQTRLLFFFQNPVYNWSTEMQGIMLSSIFYGILISQIPSGYLSGIYSLKKMIGFALLLSSVFTLLLPLAAELGEIWVIICRVIKGMFQV